KEQTKVDMQGAYFFKYYLALVSATYAYDVFNMVLVVTFILSVLCGYDKFNLQTAARKAKAGEERGFRSPAARLRLNSRSTSNGAGERAFGGQARLGHATQRGDSVLSFAQREGQVCSSAGGDSGVTHSLPATPLMAVRGREISAGAFEANP
ncbi:hypothetical protein V8G54_001970, partial [Vigna mungo]